MAAEHKAATASLTVRAARFAKVGLDDLLAARFPHCGHGAVE